MLVLLSPAKTLDFSPAETPEVTQPRLLAQTAQLIDVLRRKAPKTLEALMHVSAGLAAQNAERYRAFDSTEGLRDAKPALLAFKGDVYRGFAASARRCKPPTSTASPPTSSRSAR